MKNEAAPPLEEGNALQIQIDDSWQHQSIYDVFTSRRLTSLTWIHKNKHYCIEDTILAIIYNILNDN